MWTGQSVRYILSGQAFKYDEQRYGITYILTASASEDEILGFYTLKTSGIQVEEDGECRNLIQKLLVD